MEIWSSNALHKDGWSRMVDHLAKIYVRGQYLFFHFEDPLKIKINNNFFKFRDLLDIF